MTSHAQKKLEDEGRTGIFAPLTHPRVQIPTDINTDVVDKLSECTEGNSKDCSFKKEEVTIRVAENKL